LIGRPRTIRWADEAGAKVGLEHCELRPEAGGLLVSSVVAGTIDGVRFGLAYTLSIDAAWRVRTAELRAASGRVRRLDREGERWRIDGAPAPGLDGCIDIDIRATPFTNTLPIRRLALSVGQSAEIAVAYVDVPDLTVTASRQLYTRVGQAAYRFESLEDGFRADLPVDPDGLVTDYPGLFRRLA